MTKRAKRHSRQLGWDEALTRFERHLRARRLAERTVEGYLLFVSYLREHLEGVRDAAKPADVTLDDLRRYQAGLVSGETSRTGKRLVAACVSGHTIVLGLFFAFLFDEEQIPADPARRLERPRVPEKTPGDVLTVPEVKRLLAAPDASTPLGLRDRAILDVLYSTGLRRSELLALDLTDLDEAERDLAVRHGKGDKGRVVPLGRSAFHSLGAYLDQGRPALVKDGARAGVAIFLNHWGTRLGADGIQDALARYGKLIGLKKKLRCHTMRRTCATHLLRAGASVRHIQLLLGHSSLDTTAIYLRLDTRELRESILTKHPRERLDA